MVNSGRNGIRVEIFQTHDRVGCLSEQRFQHWVYPQPFVTDTEAVFRFLKSLNPTLVEPLGHDRGTYSGIYWYSDPRLGSGWLRVEPSPAVESERLDEIVRLHDIYRVVGPDPWKRVEDVRHFKYSLLRSSSPVVGGLFGLIAMAGGISVILSIPIQFANEHLAVKILLLLLGVILVGSSASLLAIQIKRWKWWIAARAEAKKCGRMPRDLGVLGIP